MLTVFQSFASSPSLTPDDDVFKHLALTYAQNHPTMSRGLACKAGTPSFPNGITNGAAWYPLTGKDILIIYLLHFIITGITIFHVLFLSNI